MSGPVWDAAGDGEGLGSVPRDGTVPVVAIDGPAAAGKGTLARRLAAALGFAHMDTGLLYRAVGRRLLDSGDDPGDPDAAERAAHSLQASDLERTDLRVPEVDAASSKVAAHAGVRAELLTFQRRFGLAARPGAVLDGRDIGTAVFPDAAAKLFVTATPEERARRRWLEQRSLGLEATLDGVLARLEARDTRDAARSAAPMRPAPDAYVLDTTHLGPDAALEQALAVVRQRIGVIQAE